jgi:hypothetical protein
MTVSKSKFLRQLAGPEAQPLPAVEPPLPGARNAALARTAQRRSQKPEVALEKLPSGVTLVTIRTGRRTLQDVVPAGEDAALTVQQLTQQLLLNPRPPKERASRPRGESRRRGGSKRRIYPPRPCPRCHEPFTPSYCKQTRCEACPPSRKSTRCSLCTRQFFPTVGDPNSTCPKCRRPRAPDEIRVVVVRDSVLGIDRRREYGLPDGPVDLRTLSYRL